MHLFGTMDNMIRIETILTGIAAFLLLAFLVIMPIDIMDFYEDKETYVMVHGLNTNENNWEWQYLDRWVYLGLLSVIGLTIIVLRHIKKDNKTIQKINWTFLLLFFGSMIIGFYSWMRTGFDH
jgi:DMSO reductase anchor subunit